MNRALVETSTCAVASVSNNHADVHAGGNSISTQDGLFQIIANQDFETLNNDRQHIVTVASNDLPTDSTSSTVAMNPIVPVVSVFATLFVVVSIIIVVYLCRRRARLLQGKGRDELSLESDMRSWAANKQGVDMFGLGELSSVCQVLERDYRTMSTVASDQFSYVQQRLAGSDTGLSTLTSTLTSDSRSRSKQNKTRDSGSKPASSSLRGSRNLTIPPSPISIRSSSPSSLVSLNAVDGNADDQFYINHGIGVGNGSSMTSAAATVTHELFRAMYPYAGCERDDQLSFEVGDVIRVTQVTADGWWMGNFNGRTGWFPGSYVEPATKAIASSCRSVRFSESSECIDDAFHTELEEPNIYEIIDDVIAKPVSEMFVETDNVTALPSSSPNSDGCRSRDSMLAHASRVCTPSPRRRWALKPLGDNDVFKSLVSITSLTEQNCPAGLKSDNGGTLFDSSSHNDTESELCSANTISSNHRTTNDDVFDTPATTELAIPSLSTLENDSVVIYENILVDKPVENCANEAPSTSIKIANRVHGRVKDIVESLEKAASLRLALAAADKEKDASPVNRITSERKSISVFGLKMEFYDVNGSSTLTMGKVRTASEANEAHAPATRPSQGLMTSLTTASLQRNLRAVVRRLSTVTRKSISAGEGQQQKLTTVPTASGENNLSNWSPPASDSPAVVNNCHDGAHIKSRTLPTKKPPTPRKPERNHRKQLTASRTTTTTNEVVLTSIDNDTYRNRKRTKSKIHRSATATGSHVTVYRKKTPAWSKTMPSGKLGFKKKERQRAIASSAWIECYDDDDTKHDFSKPKINAATESCRHRRSSSVGQAISSYSNMAFTADDTGCEVDANDSADSCSMHLYYDLEDERLTQLLESGFCDRTNFTDDRQAAALRTFEVQHTDNTDFYDRSADSITASTAAVTSVSHTDNCLCQKPPLPPKPTFMVTF